MYEETHTDHIQNRILCSRDNLDLSLSDIKGCVAKLKKRDLEIHISGHALDSFVRDIKRYNLKIDISNEQKCLDSLCIRLKDAQETERRNAVYQIIKHGFEPADYFYNDGWIFVIEEGGILKTAYYKEILRKDLYRFKRKNCFNKSKRYLNR